MKVTDVDHLQDVGRLAHERDSEKYPYTHLTSLTTANYVAGNPLYDILHDGRTVFDGPPLLSLKSLKCRPLDDTVVTEWRVDMPALTTTDGGWYSTFQNLKRFTGALPNLQNGWLMFYNSGLTSWDMELPSLTDGNWMFRYAKLTEWHIDLPNMTSNGSMFSDSSLRSFDGDLGKMKNGESMFPRCPLVSFSSALPSLTNGYDMFTRCKLNLESVQTIARTIKDNNSMATAPPLWFGMAKALQGRVDAELDLIRSKGWVLSTSYN